MVRKEEEEECVREEVEEVIQPEDKDMMDKSAPINRVMPAIFSSLFFKVMQDDLTAQRGGGYLKRANFRNKNLWRVEELKTTHRQPRWEPITGVESLRVTLGWKTGYIPGMEYRIYSWDGKIAGCSPIKLARSF